MRFFPLASLRFCIRVAAFGAMLAGPLAAQPIMERLSRGVIAVQEADGSVFVSWRLLASDPADQGFDVYRTTTYAEGGKPIDFGIYGARKDVPSGTVKLNDEPLTGPTWFIDHDPSLSRETTYTVQPAGSPAPDSAAAAAAPRFATNSFTLPAGAEPLPYHAIHLHTPPGYVPGDCSMGDLDGDGTPELIVKQEQNPQDNSHSGMTGETLLQAYKLDGTYLWTINLGKNIREGAHYTQFMVYDFDCDGRAELACKTSDGTVDGTGKVLGDPKADHRNDRGHVLAGPEWLTMFDGLTGAALSTVPYVPGRYPGKEDPTSEELRDTWGDGNGNRSDRYLAGVAYLDGVHPSLIMCRGYYTRSTLAAWDWDGKALELRWFFDSDDPRHPENRAYRGQGNHSLSVADVDGDGRQEIVYGACVIDDDGRGLYSTGWGHGDALHVGDLVPSRPGLEIFDIQERFDGQGISMRDAATGTPIYTVASVKAYDSGGDKGEGPGRGMAANIDPRYPGDEGWAIGASMTGVYSADGQHIYERAARLPANFAVWWDGDLLREMLDQNMVVKWNWQKQDVDTLLTAHNCISADGTKATPALSADLWGDWREEVIWATRDGQELRIYTSTIPTDYRITTLLHDPQYRVAIAWQNTAYNQPPHPSFELDPALPLPPQPKVAFPPVPGARN